MYFFYIDESGNRDVKVEEPYVLVAVGIYENQWRDFNRHLTGMKTNIARRYKCNIGQDQLEVKANLLTKPTARKKDPFFSQLTQEDVTHISTHYYEQLARSKMVVIAVIVDKTKLHSKTTSRKMHSKAYELLLERIQHYMWNEHRKHHALIIHDDTTAGLNRYITLMHARFLGAGNTHMDFRNIIEYPFFVSSELSNGVQLADMVAYSLYFTFKHNRPEYGYLDTILPRISRHKDDPNSLAGLKIWPDSAQFLEICNELQQRVSHQS